MWKPRTIWCCIIALLWQPLIYCQQTEWYGYLKGNAESGVGIASMVTDSLGNFVIAGSFGKRVDFDITDDVHEVTSGSPLDYFLAKYSPAGELLWHRRGSHAGVYSHALHVIELDRQGYIFASGRDQSPDASIVLKFNPEGQFLWKKSLAFINYNGYQYSYSAIYSIEPALDGGVLVQGSYTDSIDFDPGPGEHVLYPNGNANVFFLKLDANGNFVWVRNLGGIPGTSKSFAEAKESKMDANGNFYVFGGFSDSTDFDLDTGLFVLHSSHSRNLFLAKYSSTMDLHWVKQFSGSYYDWQFAQIRGDMDLAPGDSIYVLVPCVLDAIYDVGGDNFEFTCPQNTSLHFMKLSPEGQLIWSLPFAKGQNVGKVTALSDGNVLVSSATASKGDIDPRPEGAFLYDFGDTQQDFSFFAKYDRDGRFLWSRRVGNGISWIPFVPDSFGNVYVYGGTSSELNLIGDGGIPPVSSDPAAYISFILKYRLPVCDSLEEDYMIADFTMDTGAEPNPVNLPSWKSPNFRFARFIHDEYDSGLISYNQFNDVYIKIRVKNVGCNASTDAKVNFYYSLEPTGMAWPEAWNDFPMVVSGDTIMAGDKFGEVSIPVLYRGDTWEAIIQFQHPVDPRLLDPNGVNIGILGRIESSADPDTFPYTGNLPGYIHDNNNVAWRVVKFR